MGQQITIIDLEADYSSPLERLLLSLILNYHVRLELHTSIKTRMWSSRFG